MIVSYIVCIGSWARVRRLKLVEVKLCKKKFSPKWGMGLFPHRQGTTLHLPLEHSKRHIFQNIEITSKKKWFKMNFFLVKLLFTTICFVDFYSVPNLIVIIFNLLYPVCIVGFHCKGCVIERVVWRLKHLKTKEGFASISQLASREVYDVPCTCWNAKIQARWRQLCLASISRVRPSHKTLARHSILPACLVWYTLSVPTLFIPILPTNVRRASERKP